MTFLVSKRIVKGDGENWVSYLTKVYMDNCFLKK